jgi:hypothetical protein
MYFYSWCLPAKYELARKQECEYRSVNRYATVALLLKGYSKRRKELREGKCCIRMKSHKNAVGFESVPLGENIQPWATELYKEKSWSK